MNTVAIKEPTIIPTNNGAKVVRLVIVGTPEFERK